MHVPTWNNLQDMLNGKSKVQKSKAHVPCSHFCFLKRGWWKLCAYTYVFLWAQTIPERTYKRILMVVVPRKGHWSLNLGWEKVLLFIMLEFLHVTM